MLQVFDSNDVSLTNATISNFTAINSSEYSATITAISEGDITVDINANVAIDIANNQNLASYQVKNKLWTLPKPSFNYY